MNQEYSEVNVLEETWSRFCDFCECDTCKYGEDWLFHAETAGGRWICDVCWRYDQCTSGPNRSTTGPCEDVHGNPVPDCPHRPTLKTGVWSKWNVLP